MHGRGDTTDATKKFQPLWIKQSDHSDLDQGPTPTTPAHHKRAGTPKTIIDPKKETTGSKLMKLATQTEASPKRRTIQINVTGNPASQGKNAQSDRFPRGTDSDLTEPGSSANCAIIPQICQKARSFLKRAAEPRIADHANCDGLSTCFNFRVGLWNPDFAPTMPDSDRSDGPDSDRCR